MKKERKAKDRLDFDFPTSSTTFQPKIKGKDLEGERVEADAYDVDGSGRDAWDSGGHVNLFADLERVSSKTPLVLRCSGRCYVAGGVDL